MTKIALGVIGTGLAMRELHGPVFREMKEQYEIVAVCNRSPESAQTFAAEMGITPAFYTDHRALLARQDIEAVNIAVPIKLT
jgi:predicted dehydrogenase